MSKQSSSDRQLRGHLEEENLSRTSFSSSDLSIGYETGHESNATEDSNSIGSVISIDSINNCNEVAIGRSNTRIYKRGESTDIHSDFHEKEAIIDQTKMIMDSHERKHTYVQTQAFQKARRILDRDNIVVLRGGSGTGKTSLGLDLLIHFSNLSAFTAVPLMFLKATEWRKFVDKKQKAVILLDDMFGKIILNMKNFKQWEEMFDLMYAAFVSKAVYIIITVRQYIFAELRDRLRQNYLFQSKHIVDVVFTSDEKNAILLSHLSECLLKKQFKMEGTRITSNDGTSSFDTMKITNQVSCPVGFPKCCFAFANTERFFNQGLDFFNNPIELLAEEIISFRDEDPMKFCVLLCIVLSGKGGLCEDNLECSEALQQALTYTNCGCCQNIQQALKRTFVMLNPEFVEHVEETNSYVLSCNAVRDAVCIAFGLINPTKALEHSSWNVLRNYTSHCQSQVEQIFIRIFPSNYNAFVRSIFRHMENMNGYCELLAHPLFLDRRFCNAFLKNVTNLKKEDKTSIFIQNNESESFLYCLTKQENEHFDRVEGIYKQLLVIYHQKEKSRCLDLACERDNLNAFKNLVHDCGRKVNGNILVLVSKNNSTRILDYILPRCLWARKDLNLAISQEGVSETTKQMLLQALVKNKRFSALMVGALSTNYSSVLVDAPIIE